MIDFKNDLRIYAIRTLKHYGVKYKDKDDLITLLVKMHTFWEKYITPQPRTVMESKELTKSLANFPNSVQIAVEKMKEWISAGIDINAFQSRGLRGSGSRDYQNAVTGLCTCTCLLNKRMCCLLLKRTALQNRGNTF